MDEPAWRGHNSKAACILDRPMNDPASLKGHAGRLAKPNLSSEPSAPCLDLTGTLSSLVLRDGYFRVLAGVQSPDLSRM